MRKSLLNGIKSLKSARTGEDTGKAATVMKSWMARNPSVQKSSMADLLSKGPQAVAKELALPRIYLVECHQRFGPEELASSAGGPKRTKHITCPETPVAKRRRKVWEPLKTHAEPLTISKK